MATVHPSPFRITLMLLGGAALAGCIGEAAPYFPTSSSAPTLERIGEITCDAGSALEEGVAGGQAVTLYGQQLNGDQLSVRFGDRSATILPFDLDDGHVTVLSPPGPVSGGSVDVVISHAGGVAVCRGAYTYQVPDEGVFEREAGSLELIGYAGAPGQAARHEGALDFWAGFRPRQAGSMLPAGALYYLPFEPATALSWPVSAGVPSVNPYGTVELVSQLSLIPDEEPDIPPFTFALDPFTGDYSLCPGIDGVEPTWLPGTTYRLSASGEALREPFSVSLSSPPALVGEGDDGKLPGVKYDESGRALINQEVDLVLQFGIEASVAPDAAYMLVELLVDAGTSTLDGRILESARLVARADDETGVARIPALDLQTLGEAESGEPLTGILRLTHHYLYRVAMPEGVAGCAEPGQCAGEGHLVVDLVSAYEVPALFAPFYIFACEDESDNDGDGLIDLEDPGCAEAEDDDEKDQSGGHACDNGLDDEGDGLVDLGDPGCEDAWDSSELAAAGTYPCDDNADNDGDGQIDYRLSGGDPGCTSPTDPDERGVSDCDDGEDNDGDGDIDYRPGGGGDPGCESSLDAKETKDALLCDDGADNEGDGLIDVQDPGCFQDPADPRTYSQFEADEFNDDVECDDGKDNDQDGGIDYRVKQTANGDRQCKDAFDASELVP